MRSNTYHCFIHFLRYASFIIDIHSYSQHSGLFIYTYQGQFAVLVSNQGISVYGFQAATNAMSIVSSLILACLYDNKVCQIISSTNVSLDMEILALRFCTRTLG